MPKRYERFNRMDLNTQEIMKDRIRHQIKHEKEFSDFLNTIDWNQETWLDKYNNSDDAIKDLIDLWYEVKEEDQ